MLNLRSRILLPLFVVFLLILFGSTLALYQQVDLKIVFAACASTGIMVFIALFAVLKFTERQIVGSQNRFIQEKQDLKAEFAVRERKLRRNVSDSRDLVEFANSIILRWKPDGTITYLNRYARQFFACTEETIVGKNLIGTLVRKNPAALEGFEAMILDSDESSQKRGSFEQQNQKQDGSCVWISWANRVVSDNQGKIIENVSIGHDITAKKATENELKLAVSVFENVVEGVMITDAQGLIIRTNRAYTKITGYTQQESVGKTPGEVLGSDRHVPSFFREMWNALKSKGSWKGEVWNKRKSGELYPQWLGISSVIDENTKTLHYAGVFTDITDQKANEQEIYHLAHYDSLTNLPNRLLFQDRLNQILVDAKRNEKMVPLLFLDLDRFKPVNDSLGHGVGDLLLQKVARRLSDCLRESDTSARMGGDEFTVIIGSVNTMEEMIASATRVSQNILRELNKPFDLEGNEIVISVSIGIATYPQDGQTLSHLLRKADVAMYHAKKQAAGFLFFEAPMNRTAVDRLIMENHLYKALQNEEFELYYQPCVNLLSGYIDSVEALIRWNHPHRGNVTPDEFIGIAEESELIVQIGDWVIRQAVAKLLGLRAKGIDSIAIAVNISPRQLNGTALVETIESQLKETGFPADRLILEMTEHVFLDPVSESVTQMVKLLSDLGIRFSIDDFGTGYSSLSRLKHLPVDTLKIDRSFVEGITDDPNDAAITRAVIDMAHNLQMKVIAEGVETFDQIEFLQKYHCDIVQGYFFSRPVTAANIDYILANNSNLFELRKDSN